MKTYIEREAVLTDDVYGMGIMACVDSVKRMVMSIPAADVAPVVHGRWIKPTRIGYRAFNIPHCSACDGVPCGVDENTKYCPNCGAKMDGGKNDAAD